MPSGVLRAERPEQGVRRVAVVRVAVRTSWEFRHLVSFITIAYFVRLCTEVCPDGFMDDGVDAPSSVVHEPGMTQLMRRAGAGGAARVGNLARLDNVAVEC
jgi:hypothetical protein